MQLQPRSSVTACGTGPVVAGATAVVPAGPEADGDAGPARACATAAQPAGPEGEGDAGPARAGALATAVQPARPEGKGDAGPARALAMAAKPRNLPNRSGRLTSISAMSPVSRQWTTSAPFDRATSAAVPQARSGPYRELPAAARAARSAAASAPWRAVAARPQVPPAVAARAITTPRARTQTVPLPRSPVCPAVMVRLLRLPAPQQRPPDPRP
jgi:hypothetical protein